MNVWARLGAGCAGAIRRTIETAAVSAGLLALAAHRRRWPRTTRTVLGRQILFTGVDAIPFILAVSVAVGLTVVLQTKVWLGRVGQSAMAGPILVAVVVRELGPLLVNFVVIGRSGTAIASELASMRVAGEIEVLESQGLDPSAYLVLPRAVGMAISVAGLTVIFTVTSFVSGYLGGRLLGAPVGSGLIFMESVLDAISRADVVNLLAKSLLPGWLTAVECSIEGLSAESSVSEVPQATTRGVVRSVASLFLISILISVLTYL